MLSSPKLAMKDVSFDYLPKEATLCALVAKVWVIKYGTFGYPPKAGLYVSLFRLVRDFVPHCQLHINFLIVGLYRLIQRINKIKFGLDSLYLS